MSDYNAGVYRAQGGDVLVIGSTGALNIQGAVYGAWAGVNYYVNSVDGASGNDGLSWATAKATLAQAMALATASNGDVIHVSPFHAETIVAAAGGLVSKIGVTVLGYGRGRQRPTFTFTTLVAASFDITAAKCAILNCVFINGIDAQTAMINVTGADCVIQGCEIVTGDATTQTLEGILTTAAATRLRVEDNHIHGTVDAGTTSAIHFVGGDSLVIRNNVIHGAHGTTGSILNDTTASTNVTISGNRIVNATADGNNKTVVLHASTTGILVDNRMAVIDSTGPAPVTAAGINVSGNYWTGAVGLTASTLM